MMFKEASLQGSAWGMAPTWASETVDKFLKYQPLSAKGRIVGGV